VLTSMFLRVLIEFLVVSCKALSWGGEPFIGLWSIIFAVLVPGLQSQPGVVIDTL